MLTPSPHLLLDIEGILHDPIESYCRDIGSYKQIGISSSLIKGLDISFDIGYRPFLVEVYRNKGRSSCYMAHPLFGYYELYNTNEPLSLKVKDDSPFDMYGVLIRIPKLGWEGERVKVMISDNELPTEITCRAKEDNLGTHIFLGK